MKVATGVAHSAVAAWLAVALAPVDARAPGEVAHYGFSHRGCSANSYFADAKSSDAARRLGRGAFGTSCMPGHLGVVLNYTCAAAAAGTATCAYDPLATPAGGGLAAGFTSGLTLEAWLVYDGSKSPGPSETVIASFSTESPDNSASLSADAFCEQPNAGAPIAFRLLQKSTGCLQLEVRTSGTDAAPACETLPATGCGAWLDTAATTPQHVVVTLDADLSVPGRPANSNAVRGPAAQPRFAIYVNKVRAPRADLPPPPAPAASAPAAARAPAPARDARDARTHACAAASSRLLPASSPASSRASSRRLPAPPKPPPGCALRGRCRSSTRTRR